MTGQQGSTRARPNGTGGEEPPSEARSSCAWTIPLLCAGIGLIACCVLIPQMDENARLLHECARLKTDLDNVNKQTEVNAEFIRRLAGDPAIAERLAQRQLRLIRENTNVLPLENDVVKGETSPFLLVAIPPPPPMEEYRPVGGRLAALFHGPRSRIHLIGLGLMLMAIGLIVGRNAADELKPEAARSADPAEAATPATGQEPAANGATEPQSTPPDNA